MVDKVGAVTGRSSIESPPSPGSAAREVENATETQIQKTYPTPTSNKIPNPELYADEDWDEPDEPLFRPKPQWVVRVESGLFLSNKQLQAIKDYRRSAKENIMQLRPLKDNKSREDIETIEKNIKKLWDLSFEDSANKRRAAAARRARQNIVETKKN